MAHVRTHILIQLVTEGAYKAAPQCRVAGEGK
jgi:hypothetical protein